MPPNILSFDPMKQERVLHPMRRTTPTVTTPAAAPNASEISSLTSMLLLRTVRDLTYNHDHVPSTPTPLPRIIDNPAELARSPLIPTPSKLRRFLQYAEDDLGVNFATSYESSLRSIGAGPDILLEISDQELSRIGLTPGDIIRLKKGSITWWNGPLAKSEPNDSAKRKRSDTTDSAIPECRKYQYERRYHDGGRARINGGKMRLDGTPPGEGPEVDYDLYYFCDNQKAWLPFPQGYTYDTEGDHEDDDPFQ
jgi:hypothetical protein